MEHSTMIKHCTIFLIFLFLCRNCVAQCPYFSQSKGLDFTISLSEIDTKDLADVEILFTNNMDSTRTICWYDFIESWGVPLNFSFSVTDEDNKYVWNKLSWLSYIDPPVIERKQKISQEITLEKGKTYRKTIKLWWPGMKKGVYLLTIYYGYITTVLSSNTITVKIK